MTGIRFKLGLATLLASVLLAGCGDTGTDKPTLTRVVSFGDSLSDEGTYAVGTIKALGGGRYTVNSATANIWLDNAAVALGLAKPCAAMTGLDGDATQGFQVPAVKVANCFAYGQGGARVTNPVGVGNKLLGGANAVLGQLTVPVATQIANHLTAVGGKFSGGDIVFVLAGANDLFINLGSIGASFTPAQALGEMSKAGTELAGYVKNQIIANGANQVVVVNIPDVSKTPFGYSQDAATQGLISQLTSTFNDALANGLAGNGGKLLYVDAFTLSRTIAAAPASFGVANGTLPACDLSAAKNPLGSSLVCNAANLIAGDTSKYQFADTVHPTPFGHQLISDKVIADLRTTGWL